MNLYTEREREAYKAGASASIYKTCGPLAEIDPIFQRRPGESLSDWRDDCIHTVRILIETSSGRNQ